MEKSKRVRRPFERDWALNMAYVAGEQYVNWVAPTTSEGYLLPMTADDEFTTHAVHNICVKIKRTEVGKLLKTRPVPVALPVTESQDDMYAAAVVEAYFRHLQDEWKFDRRLRTAADWLVTTGNVFFKWYWADGAAQIAVVSPFDMYPDPYAQHMDDCRWMNHTQFLDCDLAKDLYKGLPGANLDALTATTTSPLASVETRVFSNYSDGEHNLEGVIVNEYWERPSAACEKGCFVIWTDSGIVYESDFPYAHGRLPFTHAGNVERTNSKYFASVLDYIRPLQKELNRVENQIIENRNLANGKWFIPAEVKLDEPLVSDPRQIVTWSGNPVLDPQKWFVTPPGMSPWVGAEPDRIKAAAQDIVAQREVSNAGVPGGVSSGQAIQLLQEADDSVVASTIRSLEDSIAEGFAQAAMLFKQYGQEEIMVRAYDKDGMVEVKELTRDAISMEMRVRIQTSTGLPQTMAGKWDRVLNLVQYQVIPPDQALKMLDLSSEDPSLMPDKQHKMLAYRENKQLAAGEIIVPEPWHNHDIHLEELDYFRNTEEYRRAVKLDPEIANKFMHHEQRHKELRQQKDLELAQREASVQQAMAPPGAEGGGAPSGEMQPPQAPPPAGNGSPAPVA